MFGSSLDEDLGVTAIERTGLFFICLGQPTLRAHFSHQQMAEEFSTPPRFILLQCQTDTDLQIEKEPTDMLSFLKDGFMDTTL